MLPRKILGTAETWHCESDALSRPEQEIALPWLRRRTSPDGCENPRPRPGTMGMTSRALLIRLKSMFYRASQHRIHKWVDRTVCRTYQGIEVARKSWVADPRKSECPRHDPGVGGEVDAEVYGVERSECAS